MTYSNLDTQEMKYFQEEYTLDELQDWFGGLAAAYKKWADFQFEWRKIRQSSIVDLPFPFPYRKGQKELAAGVYRTIARRRICLPGSHGSRENDLYPVSGCEGGGRRAGG